MSATSTSFSRTDDWEHICFPVAVQAFSDIATGYTVAATDRQRLVVGQPQPGQNVIYAVQSNEYTLIPNTVIRDVVQAVVGPSATLDARMSPLGEFSLNVIIPGHSLTIGNHRDTLHKNIMIQNSYNGKAPFRIQGSQLAKSFKKVRETRMKVSYYRLVCSNGLMGWSDDFLSMDEYLAWLLKGQPKKYVDTNRVRTTIDEGYDLLTEEEELLLNRRFNHKGLDLDWFGRMLERMLIDFVAAKGSLTHQVYQQFAQHPITPANGQQLLIDAKLPKMLARQAISRMHEEERLLDTGANLWLLYNGANYVLNNQQSSLSMSDRSRQDEAIFHRLAAVALAGN